MNDEHPANPEGANPRLPEGEPVVPPMEEVERHLLAQLQDEAQDHKSALKQLAQIYGDTRRYDQAQDALRQLLTLEPDLELKAGLVLAMGATAEKMGNFEAAVRLYREALAMEPMRNNVWFFIHNNLGYSLNRLGQFAEGESFCRKAIDIDSGRPNGHKNLGIALGGQGQYSEAARCFVTATKVDAGDPRSLNLLRELLQQHPELEFDYGEELARCEQSVKFAAQAIQRAQTGKVFKVLLGANAPGLDDLLAEKFCAITGGAVDILATCDWKSLTDTACHDGCNLVLVVPNRHIGEAGSNNDAWQMAVDAMRLIKSKSAVAIIVCGGSEDLAEHGQSCLEAGADAIIEMPFAPDTLEETARRLLTGG